MKIVMKFGGTSVADTDCMKRAASIVSDFYKQGNIITVVVSALSGVTDKLIEISNKALKVDLDNVHNSLSELKERHFKVFKNNIQIKSLNKQLKDIVENNFNELEKVLTGIAYLGELTPKSLDYVLSFGERLSTSLFCSFLSDLGLDAVYLTGKKVGIITDSNYGDARPLLNLTKHQVSKELQPLLDKGVIPVITGYIASNQEGFITTLGRGGSDYTATLIGAAIGADEIWIWTDVNGMMTANPKVVKNAKTILELSFQEAMEMAIFGAKGLHPSALEPAMMEGIRVRIKNTFNPLNHGTSIIKDLKVSNGQIVKAVSLIKKVSLINVSGAGMVGAPGTAAKIFDVLGKNNVNVLMISQSASEANISFIIRREQLEKAISILEIALLGKGIIREISSEKNVCIVAIVGAGMKGTLGVASKVFKAVSQRGINIIMISQGSSEVNISFVVQEDDGEEAVRAIHEEFKLGL